MRGFVIGSLGLIALEVFTRPRAAGATSDAARLISRSVARFMSARFAGVPRRQETT